MLQPLMHVLQSKKIILASGSPRRKQILDLLGFPFEVKVSEFEENLDKRDFIHPHEYAKENAKCKALNVAKHEQAADLVIGADTVVSLNGTIYEKPKNREEAIAMLSILSGKTHVVSTGVALIRKLSDSSSGSTTNSSVQENYETSLFHEETVVVMANLPLNVIEAYIDTGEPMDKAGGYGIQGLGATLVEGIQGDYFNVVGFPLFRFCNNLAKMYK